MLPYFSDISNNWCLHKADSKTEQDGSHEHFLRRLCIIEYRPGHNVWQIHKYHSSLPANLLGHPTRQGTSDWLRNIGNTS